MLSVFGIAPPLAENSLVRLFGAPNIQTKCDRRTISRIFQLSDTRMLQHRRRQVLDFG